MHRWGHRLFLNRRVTIGVFPSRFVDGESSVGRFVALVEDDESADLKRAKAKLPKTRFGDCYREEHVEQLDRLSAANYA